MRRAEKKLFKIHDELRALAEEERLVAAELEYHRSIHEDAVRDADVTGHYIDKEEADLTAGDVTRFERRLKEIAERRRRLEKRRLKLLAKVT